MPQVTKQEKDKTTEEIAKDLTRACNTYVIDRRSGITTDNNTIMLIRILAEELLRWRML